MGTKVIKRIGGDGQALEPYDWQVHAQSHNLEFTVCGMAFDYDNEKVRGKPGAELTAKPVTCQQCINELENAQRFFKKRTKWY